MRPPPLSVYLSSNSTWTSSETSGRRTQTEALPPPTLPLLTKPNAARISRISRRRCAARRRRRAWRWPSWRRHRPSIRSEAQHGAPRHRRSLIESLRTQRPSERPTSDSAPMENGATFGCARRRRGVASGRRRICHAPRACTARLRPARANTSTASVWVALNRPVLRCLGRRAMMLSNCCLNPMSRSRSASSYTSTCVSGSKQVKNHTS